MAVPNSDPSPEAKELALVGKVEFRIAAAESEAKLESLLKTYLAPLLLKLASEHLNVRNKVISVCQHVNTRVKTPSIQLPVEALLRQYKERRNNLIRHFDLLYIQQGLDRLPIPERLNLLPILLRDLSKDFQESSKSAAGLFNIFLKLLPHLKLPPRGSKEDLELRDKLSLNAVDDASFVASWLGKLILFSTSSLTSKTCPGLGEEDLNFLQLYRKSDTWSSSEGGLNLVESKVLGAKLLVSGAFHEDERFLPALFASADANSRLSDIGDDMLKRALPVVSLEDSALVDQLYGLYLGNKVYENFIPPARPTLQRKILGLLSKSQIATSRKPQIISIVRDGLGHNTESGTTKQGLEASKLRTQIFNFTTWIARMASASDMSDIAPEVVGNLRSYIEGQGWPVVKEDVMSNAAELSSRSYGYESIGLLAKSSPRELLEGNLDLLRWLFSSLAGDSSGKDVSMSIEGALSSILGAFAGVGEGGPREPLIHLLLYYAKIELGQTDSSGTTVIRSTRYVATKFANRCLPFSDVSGRLIALIALSVANDRNEVIEEGKRGLDPYWHKILNPRNEVASHDSKTVSLGTSNVEDFNMPVFEDLVQQIFLTGDRGVKLGHGYAPAVLFCWTVLLHGAISATNKAPPIDPDWQKNVDALVRNDEEVRMKVKSHLQTKFGTSTGASGVLERYGDAALEGFVSGSSVANVECGKCLLELCQIGPSNAVKQLSTRILELKHCIFSNNHASRTVAAHIFGLLAPSTAGSQTDLRPVIEDFLTKAQTWKNAVGEEVHRVHGSLLALTFYSCHSRMAFSIPDLDTRLIELVCSILGSSKDKELLEAATISVSQLSIFGCLRPSSVIVRDDISKFIGYLQTLAKKGDEHAVLALGHFSMQCSQDQSESPLQKIIDSLYELHELRQPELQFSVGSALSCAAGTSQSKALVGILDIEEYAPAFAERSSTLGIILSKVLDNCKQSKPSLRQASVIWLLSLVQFCGHLKEITTHLKACQTAFKGFLSDKESLNQEAASRGLAMVYERGDQELKDDLVRDLVHSFTATNSSFSGNVSADTELFEPGALPTGEGQSVTTYKDIINLANEVGDPNLVYRFMNLASNSAIWSSRSAFGRFGLSRILSESSSDGHLTGNPKLASALFRYTFDPNSNVRAAMNEIWNTLTKDNPKVVIDLHYQIILQDLMKSILNKEWRTRQASCAAMADLIQGRPLAWYEKQLTDIWQLTFKVCDDIKGTVRAAAMALARTLTGILIRSLEAGETSAATANAMLQQVLPFLLGPSGLESSAVDLQMFSLTTLIDIIKKSTSKILRPFLAELIGRLVSLLSSIEPGVVNYLYMNADKYGLTQQEIDHARLSSVKMSPMMEAIERCLDMLDESSIKDLQLTLSNAVKTAIGLPSKVGASRVIVSLAIKQRPIFSPYADGFLKLLRKQVLDRVDTISTSNAVACGYLSRIASDREILHTIDFAQKLYFESEDDRQRTIAGEILLGIAKHATDRFTSLGSNCLPFAFLGSHDTDETTKDVFKSAWEEGAGGSRAVLLYLSDIIPLASRHLDSPRWSVKHTSAFTVAATVGAAGTSLSAHDYHIIWPAIEKALEGKAWQGKERVLQAFVLFAKNWRLSSSELETKERMKDIMLRESKRNNVDYRQHAFACFGDFVEIFTSLDWFDLVYKIICPILEDLVDDVDKMDIDPKETSSRSSKMIGEQTMANGIRTLLRSVNPVLAAGTHLATQLSLTLPIVKKALKYGSTSVTAATLEGEKSLFAKLAAASRNDSAKIDEILVGYSHTLFEQESFSEPLRVKAAEAALALAPQTARRSLLSAAFRRFLALTESEERSYSVQDILKRIKVTGS